MMPVFRRLAVVVLVGYLLLVVVFYVLSGEQLHLRASRGNINMLPSTSSTIELTSGNIIEQRFIANIQRLSEISVRIGTYARENSGRILLELLQDSNVLLSGTFSASAITDGGDITITTSEPIEGLGNRPLTLRLSSDDGVSGRAVSPLINTQVKQGTLLINGKEINGTLCFSALGTDYIWTGLHYYEFAGAGFFILTLLLFITWCKIRRGKHSYIINAILAVKKYRFLIRQLVSRDFKTKYRRSVLGVFWSFLNPLLTMCVQYVVFSTLFRSDVPHFAAYLIIGIVFFGFFNEACSMTLNSIVNNASLITKVYMPKYIYPFTSVISSVVNLGISLIPLIIVIVSSGVSLKASAPLALYFLSCLIVFSLGVGMLLASSMVFFRDTQFLWGVLSMIWMYVTPIFYPETILPENMRIILHVNPLYHFITNARLCILNGVAPEPTAYVQCFFIALAALLVGSLIFRKAQNRFVLYL